MTARWKSRSVLQALFLSRDGWLHVLQGRMMNTASRSCSKLFLRRYN